MVQWVKDLVLSLQWFGLLLWHRFDPCPGKLSHAIGAAKKEKKKKKLETVGYYLSTHTQT